MFYTYQRDAGFITTQQPDLGGTRFDITEEQYNQINAGGTITVVNGQIQVDPAPPVAPPVVYVPQEVRAAQMRQYLIDQDLADMVDAAFANPLYWPTEKERLKALARWEYEVKVVRTDPLVESLAGDILGKTSKELDEIFIYITEHYP